MISQLLWTSNNTSNHLCSLYCVYRFTEYIEKATIMDALKLYMKESSNRISWLIWNESSFGDAPHLGLFRRNDNLIGLKKLLVGRLSKAKSYNWNNHVSWKGIRQQLLATRALFTLAESFIRFSYTRSIRRLTYRMKSTLPKNWVQKCKSYRDKTMSSTSIAKILMFNDCEA